MSTIKGEKVAPDNVSMSLTATSRKLNIMNQIRLVITIEKTAWIRK
jgi:hypothetical protein